MHPTPSLGAPTLTAPSESRFWEGYQRPTPQRHNSRGWYGGGAIIADVLGAGLGATGGVLARSHGNDALGLSLAIAGATTYVFTAPIIHWSRRNVWRGFVSLALRTVLPVVASLIGGAVGGGAASVIVPNSIAVVTASVIDIAVLMREPR